MSYKINNIDLSTLGITPIQFSGQSLAVSGVFDFPNRKGVTEHNWGTEIESFVSSADLEYEGRDISFKGMMKASTRPSLITNLNSLITLCKSGLLSFETRVGTFAVYQTGEIQVTEWSDTTILIEIKFRQPVVLFSTPVDPEIDYDLYKDLGIVVTKVDGKLSTSARIEVNTTGLYSNTSYRQPVDIKISCTMIVDNLADMTIKMGLLHELLSQPGLLVLSFPDIISNDVYLKTGFTVSVTTESSCQFTLNLRS